MRAPFDLNGLIGSRGESRVWRRLLVCAALLTGATLASCAVTVAGVQSTGGACPASSPLLCSDGGVCCPDEFAFCCEGTSMCGANGPACEGVTPNSGSAADAG